MANIRSRDTLPERVVRSYLHRLGFRFRIHGSLRGRPDIVLPRWGAVVFVHGCFWHRHSGCDKATSPATNRRFWNAKFAANVERDRRAAQALRRDGWRVFTVWECSLTASRLDRLAARIRGVSP